MRRLIAIILLAAVCALSASAQTDDVPREHWAYEAVTNLAAKGYVLGYPDGSFLGNRSMTRYEFATVVKRILDDVVTRMAAASGTQPTTAPAPVVSAGAATAGISAADVDRINRLVDEFKIELTVIGTRLDRVEATVKELKTQLASLDAAVNDPKGTVETTKSDVAKLKKVAISGYAQVRYQSIAFNDENKSENDQFDTFLVRRARLKMTARPTDRTTGVLQIDLGQNNLTVKDAYLNYALGENAAIAPSFQIGQQNWWFGYDVPYSSSRRETPERALFARRFFPGERDAGAVLKSPSDSDSQWTLGIYNGTGTEVGKDSSADKDDRKDALANVKWSFGDIDLGVSGYWGSGVWTSFPNKTYEPRVDKIRWGADLQWYLHNVTLKAEYIRGKGFDDVALGPIQDEWVYGYYGQLNYNLGTRNTLVARYSFMDQDPKRLAYGNRKAWDLGIIRWLDGSHRLKLFYRINDEEFETDAVARDNDGFAAEWIATY